MKRIIALCGVAVGLVAGGCVSSRSAWEANDAWRRGIEDRQVELTRRIEAFLAMTSEERDREREALSLDLDQHQRDIKHWMAEREQLAREDANRRAWWAAFGAASTSISRDMSTWRPMPSQRITPFTCREIGYQIRCF